MTSQNWDGSKMTTRKKTGKPLIDTGRMLSSITVEGAKAVVPVKYATDVQERTGNTFISTPTPDDLKLWMYVFRDLYVPRV